jgi:4-amino-4-deoxy-L-arabinose transferase-like glycosyltransferase
VAVCAGLWLLALYPSTAWDANSYHLPAARFYVEQHRLTPVWPIRYPVFAEAQELLFAAVMMVGDTVDAQLVQAILCATVALALYTTARRHAPSAGPWAVALWLGSPLVLRLGTIGYIDVGLAAFATLSVLALDREGRGWAILGAALAGFAASSKYPGLFFVGLVGVTALVRRRHFWLVAAVATLVAAPWYLYVWHSTGNPVWPFAGSWLGLGPWSPADLAAQMSEMRSHGAHGLVDVLRLPWRLTLGQRALSPETAVSPFLWAALATVVFTARRDATVRRWTAIIVAFLAYWFVTPQVYRYLVPILPLVALTGAVSLALLVGERRYARAITALFLLPGLIWGVVELRGRGLPPATPAAQEAWLAARMPAYRGVRRAATGGGRVYQLGLEDYVLYAGDAVGELFGPWRYDRLLALKDAPQAFVDELAKMDVRWLVVQRFREPAMRVPAHPRLVLRQEDAGSAVYERLP